MDRAWLLYQVRRFDWLTLLAAGTLLVFGILFIYSASYRGDGLPVAGFYQKQMVWAALGLVAMIILAFMDYHQLGNLAWLIYAGCIVLLVVVLVMGETVSGGKRWLNLFGIRIQPSEFAKLGTLILMAWYLSRPSQDVRMPRVILHAGLIAAVPFVLIFLEPDLGTAAVLVPMTAAMLFVAGMPWRVLLFLLLVGLCLLPVGWLILNGYQQERILVFFDPSRDPLGAGWNKIQSQIAVGSGGLTGKGFLAGTQNVLGFLPRKVAPTDFVYSVVAEESGFVGSTLVLSLYAALLIGIVRTALVSPDQFGRFLAIGVAAILFCHVFVNIAMTIGLMPITGLPLPLLSYGGSFTIATLCALGLVQSVYLRRARR